jgi:hypothetical protein
MNEAKPTTESQAPGSGRIILRIALFAILGVLLCAFAYEYLVARAQSAGALAKIEELDKVMGDRSEPTTDTEIQKAIGFEPIREQRDRETVVERYRWMSAVPFRPPYELWVLYKQGIDGRWMHMSHGLNTSPELVLDQLPPVRFEPPPPGQTAPDSGALPPQPTPNAAPGNPNEAAGPPLPPADRR